MDEPRLTSLLSQVAAGELTVDAAVRQLRYFALEDLGAIQLDHHRSLRVGFPEVIYAPGKTDAQLHDVITAQQQAGAVVVVTRLTPDRVAPLRDAFPDLHYDPDAAILHAPVPPPSLDVNVLVIAAGTADLPVAREAALMATLQGCQVTTLWDAGVAGIHRLTGRKDLLEAADLVIVVAGMEGALPSVVGGLLGKPLIAVPTSTGYGTGLGGFAAMLTMLNSCAAGTVTVNIDNGFGAGYFAGLLARQMDRRKAGSV
ncbi:MAG: Pyridinium-3,5-biscarboxylic acid mononucleotide synthase [bacterium]|nr:Pyridinium-3,5-biscarboxylic acid mononucleotide synthase [bacterium]